MMNRYLVIGLIFTWRLVLPLLAFQVRHVSHPTSSAGHRVLELYSTSTTSSSSSDSRSPSIADYLVGVVAPLKRIGPYPCVGLHFPDWKTDQEYDFLLDTGANVNSIQADLVDRFHLKEYSLPQQQEQQQHNKPIPLIGVTGGKQAAASSAQVPSMYLLGDCQLAGLPPPPMTFLRGLTATALKFASPVGVGLLGLPLFWSFPAGIEFDWHGTDGDAPTLVFYFGSDLPHEMAKTQNMIRIPVQTMVGGLLTVPIQVDGNEMLALVDTGSPITVVNDEAAKRLGIPIANTQDDHHDHHHDHRHKGIPGNVGIKGADGGHMSLDRLESPVSIEVLGASTTSTSNNTSTISLGQGYVWKGNLPGLGLVSRMLSQINNNDPETTEASAVPAVVLGLDFLQNAYRMIVCAPKSELWLEELPKDFERKYC